MNAHDHGRPLKAPREALRIRFNGTNDAQGTTTLINRAREELLEHAEHPGISDWPPVGRKLPLSVAHA